MMLVSWEWLTQYVELDLSPDEMASRFALSGLNHESTQRVDNDWVIDLEVTSNRGDCLGHIGIAREAAVLLGKQLALPEVSLIESRTPVDSLIQVRNQIPKGCARYTVRIIRGVKIGPSPAWMKRRLEAVGIRPINNVVDATNYVMLECGQPLHAFDYKMIAGAEIVVRQAVDKETFVAIDHRKYDLNPSMIVIADSQRAIALGGVMGGAESEVNESTTDVVIEAADFSPLLIRQAARALRLHSPSSFRFERRVDPAGIDWASRRCCQLIQQSSGGQVCQGVVHSESVAKPIPPFPIRQSKISQVLGIDVPWAKCTQILSALGCEISATGVGSANVQPPSWRHDLTREVDAIEEIVRIYGYDQIPEDIPVPITPSSRRGKDFMLDQVRNLANAAGLDETITPSIVSRVASEFLSVWTNEPAMQTQAPLLEGATFLRRSLIPSLIQAKIFNQSLSNHDANFFETATCYIPSSDGNPHLEPLMLGVVGDLETRTLRGLIEGIFTRSARQAQVQVNEFSIREIAKDSGLQFTIDGRMIAWMGTLATGTANPWKWDGAVSVAEINLDRLLEHVQMVPQLVPVISYPVIHRDLNMVVDEAVRWHALSDTVSKSAGGLLKSCDYRETYRDVQKDGAGKKRLLFSLSLQSSVQTLTGEQADTVVASVVKSCRDELGAQLLM